METKEKTEQDKKKLKIKSLAKTVTRKARKKIDWKEVEELARAGCTGSIISSTLGIHYNTLSNRAKEELQCDLCELIREWSEAGIGDIFRGQHKAAQSGSEKMLMFLGRVRAKQTESHDIEHRFQPKFKLEGEELLAEYKRRQARRESKFGIKSDE